MTRQSKLKRQVRARMAKTGESYTAARRQLLSGNTSALVRGPSPTAPFRPRYSDEAVCKATGQDWSGWFLVLDGWQATKHTHTEIARYLVQEHQMSGWWAQSVSGQYESARGMRQAHQHYDGAFAANAAKTVPASEQAVREAFIDATRRSQWLPDAPLVLRESRSNRVIRGHWTIDGSKIEATITVKGPNKTQIALSQVGVASSAAAAEMKAFWRARLGALNELFRR